MAIAIHQSLVLTSIDAVPTSINLLNNLLHGTKKWQDNLIKSCKTYEM